MSGVRRNVEQPSAMEGGSYDYEPDGPLIGAAFAGIAVVALRI
jgi:hypothetical protein